MSTVYHTSAAPCTPLHPTTFEKRWTHVESLLRLRFSVREDETHINGLIADAWQHLLEVYAVEPELLAVSSDAQWVEMALQGVLQINEGQSLFNQQFEIIQKRLHHWARQHFKREIVEDVVQGAFIKLYEDYRRHQGEWDGKHESFWVNCGKLAMRSAYRDLLRQTHSLKGSSRRAGTQQWQQQFLHEDQFQWFDTDENDQNELLDLICQRDEVDIHGAETRRANLRLDLEKLLRTVQAHYRPDIFERCLLILERLIEGYLPNEIRLELGWTKSTYDGTMTIIRRMSTFTEEYHRAPNRCTKLSEAEIARIHALRGSGCTQPEIARLIGRDHKTVWKVLQPATSA